MPRNGTFVKSAKEPYNVDMLPVQVPCAFLWCMQNLLPCRLIIRTVFVFLESIHFPHFQKSFDGN